MTGVEIHGRWMPAFAPVADAFARNVAEGAETGAAACVVQDGEVALEVWAGWADAARTQPWTQQTLTPVFSTGKAAVALVMAGLVGRGDLDYDQPVARYWPDFAQGGKASVTVAQALSHQTGITGLSGPHDPAIWLDRPAAATAIAAEPVVFAPGTACAYQPIVFGHIAGELARRVDGRSLGVILAEDWVRPLGLDIQIGVAETDQNRCAEVIRPRAAPNLGELNEETRIAFLKPWSSPKGLGSPAWRAAEIPGANAHASASGLARLLGVLATGGRLGDTRVLAEDTLEALTRERVAGPNRVLPFDLSFSAGLIRNSRERVFGLVPGTLGHAGWGGSLAFADPARGLSFAYVMNQMTPALIGDERSARMIAALYAS
ncbi:MAG: serine hydrolase domain-containing protein [Maricaulaceae bacterium]